MNKFIESKILKKKKLGENFFLKVTQNEMSGRIFVEYSYNDGKIYLQKSFQNTYEGNKESEEFSKKIKNLPELKKYFGLK